MEFKIKKLVLKEIEEQRNTYKNSWARIVADYDNELETIKEYNGRQILELLQNADDEESEEVLLELDTEKNILIIANKGSNCNPFQIGGIKSLMVSNFSPKTTKKYIGSKGLGFRSIINWSNKITIKSQSVSISFSKNIVSNFYDEICDEQKQKEIIEQRNLSPDIVPIAFLAIPEIEVSPQNEWTTIIEIEYKSDKIDDIKKQIHSIKDEILLFVNYIKILTIKVDGKSEKIEIDRDNDNNDILLDDVLWKVYEKNDLLPKEMWDKSHEEEYFELKIAIQESFNNKNNLLYSYFPTKIDIDFPFIIHGTFDLNSSRNDLNDNEKNRYILDKLVIMIIETAKILTKNEVNYKALEFLTHNSNNTTLKNLGFYQKIDESIEELEVFPCLDKNYRKKNDVVFVSDDFSKFVDKTKNQSLFQNMLIHTDDANINILDYYINEQIDNYESINNLSKNIKSIDDRIDLIYLIKNNFKNKDKKFELLIDEDNKIINLNDEVYTPKFSNMENLVLPSFVNIKFLNKELGSKLLSRFNINDKKNYRILKDKLNDITNIKEYETSTILEKIISEAKRNTTISTIKEMIRALYENFKINKVEIETKLIPLISKNDEIINSKDLYLSSTYPSGKLTEELFESTLEKNQFLANMDKFNFEVNEDKEQIERFFLWLGVNKYTIFSNITTDYKYDKYLSNKIETPQNYSRFVFEIPNIINIKAIKKINVEKIILWILKDNKIRDEISKKYEVRYIKNGGYVKHLFTYDAPSYILYQLSSLNYFKNYIITNEELGKTVNSISIDFNHELFKTYEIGEHAIKDLILKLGAKERFEDLSIDAIKTILKNLEEKSPDGKYTQTIYKAVRNHKDTLNDTNIKLCAKKEGKLDYYNQNEIFYVNTTKLPKKILNNIPIINIPPRLGNIINFFGIKDIKNIEITLISYDINDILSCRFKEFFEKMKIFILVYKFENSKKKKTKENDLNKLKNVDIHLCNKVCYKIEGNEYQLEDNDYIESNKKYYIKVANNDFDYIRKTLDFRETFADIIGSIFNINNVENFLRLVSDDIKETEEIIKRNIGYEALNEAREYFNIADEFSSFWRTVYQLKSVEYNEEYNKEYLQKIREDLNLKIELKEINYKNLKCNKSCENIKKIFSELSLDIIDFNNNEPYYKLDFIEFHKSKLKNSFNDSFYNFEQSLYKYCQINKKERKFLNLIGLYEYRDLNIDFNTIYIDYEEVVRKFITENFNFELNNNHKKQINIVKIYEKNKKEINYEKIEPFEELRSLLHFENILEEINANIYDNDNKKNLKEDKEIEDLNLKSIIKKNLSTPSISINKAIKKRTKKYSQEQNKQNKKKGDKAEKEVFNSLVEKFGKEKVKWVSNNDDNLKYDLRYSPEQGKWKYVEVKTFSNNSFYLSKNEKEFADKNKENYEIFLVGSEIYKLENIDFSNKQQFELIIDKYQVHYKLKM